MRNNLLQHAATPAISNACGYDFGLQIPYAGSDETLQCSFYLENDRIVVKTRLFRVVAQGSVDMRARMDFLEHFHVLFGNELKSLNIQPAATCHTTQLLDNHVHFRIHIPRECQDVHLWLRKNIGNFMKAAMLSAWSTNNTFCQKIRSAFMIRPQMAPDQAQLPLVRPRQEMSDGAGFDNSPRPVRPRQEMSDGAGFDNSPRPVRPRQEMSDGAGFDNSASGGRELGAQDYQNDAEIRLIIENSYSRLAQNGFSQRNGVETHPVSDGSRNRSAASMSPYMEQTNKILFEAPSDEQALKTFWDLWKQDKTESNNKRLKTVQQTRIEFLLAGINQRWEDSKLKSGTGPLQVQPGTVFYRVVAQDSLEKIIAEHLTQADRTHKIHRKAIMDFSRAVHGQVCNEYYARLARADQEFMIKEIHQACDEMKDHIGNDQVVFTCTNAEDCAEFTVKLPGTMMIFSIKVVSKDGRDLKFIFDGALSNDELEDLRDTVFKDLTVKNPNFEILDLAASTTNAKTTMICVMRYWTPILSRVKNVLSMLTTFTTKCMAVFLTVSTRVEPEIQAVQARRRMMQALPEMGND